MKKIASLFARDGAVLTRDFNPAALWVVNGEGTPTRKWDGTAARVLDGKLYARYDANGGKPFPPGLASLEQRDDGARQRIAKVAL